ncbi:hypothetical protein D8S78_00165 [Natrialba swarupiae]|nr:hypothetical protein [Natrialba swarupiae]
MDRRIDPVARLLLADRRKRFAERAVELLSTPVFQVHRRLEPEFHLLDQPGRRDLEAVVEERLEELEGALADLRDGFVEVVDDEDVDSVEPFSSASAVINPASPPPTTPIDPICVPS